MIYLPRQRQMVGAAAFLVLALGMHQGVAWSAGTFTATGSMADPRIEHTSTLLYTGKVLVAGGMTMAVSGAFASAVRPDNRDVWGDRIHERGATWPHRDHPAEWPSVGGWWGERLRTRRRWVWGFDTRRRGV
jgi:hypothetical protein